jgi:dihydropteroate synthase
VTSTEIKIIIENELRGQTDLSNVYGLNLNKCLIEPVKEKYKSSTDDSVIFDLWTVLEETKDKTGYKITFDESNKTFGLGILTDKNELMDIGTYGSFLETLKGM